MKNIIKNNKNKIIIVSAIMTVTILILELTINNTNLIKNSLKIAKVAEDETTYAYNNPYIPDGFSFVEGTYNTGYVIQDITSGSQFVWVPVDGTNIKLERRDFATTDVEMSACVEELNEKFSESVSTYGGFYVARYEAGIPDGKTFDSEDDMDCTGKPVFKKGATVWNNISYANARTSAEQLYARKSEITSSLMNSYAYDTLLTWIATNSYNVENNSRSWGNYADSNLSNGKVETAGSSENWKANNIYDIAGNVTEWTSERYDDEYISRGGSYFNDGNVAPAGIREENNEEKVSNTLGFRAILYKTGEATIEGYDEPYVPDGFTHTEGEWNTGFVIKETATENEFVWIPVDGYNLKLDRSEFENTFLTMSNCADELDEDFKASVYTYGGYYVGRYEAGVGTTSGNNTGVPVTKKGATVWTNISWTNAKASAEQMYTTNNLNSRLMSSYAYDTMLEWMKLSEYSIQTYDVDNNSTSWGNYKNNTNGTKTNKAQSGSNNTWIANNIYDIAGNVWEWTTETSGKDNVVRGGDYLSNGDILPAGTRDHAIETTISDYTGFRVLLYQDAYIVQNNGEIKIAAGKVTSFSTDKKGRLWAWGYTGNGLIPETERTGLYGNNYPVKIDTEIEISEVSLSKDIGTGGLIDIDGDLWTFGENTSGMLGTGSIDSVEGIIKIMGDTKFKKVRFGGNHAAAIDVNDNLYTWGSNNYGQLGTGTSTSTLTLEPMQIMENTKFIDVSLGSQFSMAIDSDGNLYTWGRGTEGQLGNGGSTLKTSPTIIKSGTKFKSISAGSDTAAAIDENGNLYTWGNKTTYGNLGTQTSNTKSPVLIKSGIKDVKMNATNGIALDEDDGLWTWGRGFLLGSGTATNSSTPTQIMSETKFIQIDLGSQHALAIDTENNIWAWGNNSNGQLGNGTYTNPTPNVPIKVNLEE